MKKLKKGELEGEPVWNNGRQLTNVTFSKS